MYNVAIKRDFIAQHYLIGGDWGKENQKHSHHYRVELLLEGGVVDRHCFLVDIREIEALLNTQVLYFKDKILNELPEFEELNPSIECFAFVLCKALYDSIQSPNVDAITVKIWEKDTVWASYRHAKHGNDV